MNQWILISERKPTEADADCFGKVWIWHPHHNAWLHLPFEAVGDTPWQPTGFTKPSPYIPVSQSQYRPAVMPDGEFDFEGWYHNLCIESRKAMEQARRMQKQLEEEKFEAFKQEVLNGEQFPDASYDDETVPAPSPSQPEPDGGLGLEPGWFTRQMEQSRKEFDAMCPNCKELMRSLGSMFSAASVSPEAKSEIQPESSPSAIDLVVAERKRQMDVEGWTSQHDDKHLGCQLAKAAACYASPDRKMRMDVIDYGWGRKQKWVEVPVDWPWEVAWWKVGPNRIRELVKAGALIVAEIERLQRLKNSSTTPAPVAIDPEGGTEAHPDFIDEVAKVEIGDNPFPQPSASSPAVDWSKAPEWAMWAAVDEDGCWTAYSYQPIIRDNDNYWSCPAGLLLETNIHAVIFARLGMGNPPFKGLWTESLQQRPVPSPAPMTNREQWDAVAPTWAFKLKRDPKNHRTWVWWDEQNQRSQVAASVPEYVTANEVGTREEELRRPKVLPSPAPIREDKQAHCDHGWSSDDESKSVCKYCGIAFVDAVAPAPVEAGREQLLKPDISERIQSAIANDEARLDDKSELGPKRYDTQGRDVTNLPGLWDEGDKVADDILREISRTGMKGFATSQSCGPDNDYKVVVKFQNIEDMQALERSAM